MGRLVGLEKFLDLVCFGVEKKSREGRVSKRKGLLGVLPGMHPGTQGSLYSL